MKLYIFNPDTDLALANNRENYMPPARVKQMTQELELLPLWYAENGSHIIISATQANSEFINKIKEFFGIEISYANNITQTDNEFEISPWGWNIALRKQLLNKGIENKHLPSLQELSQYRELSGRDKDTEILRNLQPEKEFTAEIINNIEECRKYAQKNPRCIFKAPWSGSGKGLLWCYGKYDEKSDGWCQRVIKEQGFVVATPIYEKLQDFAMEYYSDGKGNISFVGYSLFRTNTKGAYQGNILQSPQQHRETLSQYIDLQHLDTTDNFLRKELSSIYAHKYKGYIGVDMIICRTNSGKNSLHPCVEVNMRMNMGVLSTIIANRFLSPQSKGIFSIEYYPTSTGLQHFLSQMNKEYPLVIESNKITSGFMPLIPISKSNNYIAYIKVEREN